MEQLILIAVILLTQIVKGKIYPKFGATGVHIFTFVISLIGYGIYLQAITNPDFMTLVSGAIQFLIGAVAVYEVILKRIGFKSVEEAEEKKLKKDESEK